MKSDQRLALLAHDLRTPLSAMRITADLVAQESLSPRQKERLALLVRAIDALSEMTGELLSSETPTRSASETVDAAGSGVDLAQVLEDTVDLFQAQSALRDIAIRYENLIEGRVSVPAGLASTLRRVASALIDNSVKYAGSGTISLVMCEELGDTADDYSLHLIITDEGPGISAAEQKRLFKPFVRGVTGQQNGAGSGLGLWGAKEMIEDAGGVLKLTSSAGKGCRFDILVPLDGAPVDRTSADSEAPDRHAHVLVVDDNRTNQVLMATLLDAFGISCDFAASGDEAVRKAEQSTYDGALIDLHMPGMNGRDTLSALRGSGHLVDAPVLAVTAAETLSEAELKEDGFSALIAKPLSPAAFLRALSPVFEHRARLEEGGD